MLVTVRVPTATLIRHLCGFGICFAVGGLASGCSHPTDAGGARSGRVVIEGHVGSEAGDPVGQAVLTVALHDLSTGERLGPFSVGESSSRGDFSGVVSVPRSDGIRVDVTLICQPPFGSSLAPDTVTFPGVRLLYAHPDTIRTEILLSHAGRQ